MTTFSASLAPEIQGEVAVAPPLRVLFLIPSLRVGGAERQLVVLAAALKKAGHVPAIAAFSPEGPLEQVARGACVPIHDLGRRSRWSTPAALARLVRLSSALRPDVVYSYLPVPNIASALVKPLLRPARLVWGSRCADVDWARIYGRKDQLAYALEARLSRIPDRIIFNSQRGMSDAKAKGFPSRACVAIPNGIDCAAFAPDRRLGRELRERWGAATDTLLVGMVARIDPRKNHKGFLRIAQAVRQRVPPSRFVCIGGGSAPLLADLKAESARLGLEDCVAWAGPIADMNAAYNGLDLMVLPSFGEGFPNAVGEAMACGVPCVASAVGDVNLLIRDAGEVVYSQDADDLAAAVERILRLDPSDRAALGRAARERVASEFSVEVLVRRTVSVLREAATAVA